MRGGSIIGIRQIEIGGFYFLETLYPYHIITTQTLTYTTWSKYRRAI